MKTVIAPVDFSKESMNALSFAAELSKRAEARLVIANIIKSGESKDESKEKLSFIESDLKKKFWRRIKL